VHTQLFESLKTALNLEESDYPETLGLATWEAAGMKGKIWGYKGESFPLVRFIL
jgi:hypothetical protein